MQEFDGGEAVPLRCEGVRCRREEWLAGRPSKVESFTGGFSAGLLHGFSGEDGCGKGLLLNILGLLEPPDAGEIFVGGEAVSGLSTPDLTRLRNVVFGFVFSHPALLPSFTVIENVAMPLFRIRGEDPAVARERSLEVLDFCGISESCDALAGRLSGPALARAALARALVHSPRVLIGISPRHAEDILPLARRACHEFGTCVLWAGEAQILGRVAHRMLHFAHGQLCPEVELT